MTKFIKTAKPKFKLFKGNKKGILPIVWAVVVVGGLFGLGNVLDVFKPEQQADLFFGLPIVAWVIISILTFIIVKKK